MTFFPFNPSMVRDVPKNSRDDRLLDQTGWFSLPEVCRSLFPRKPSRYKLVFKQVERLQNQGLDPWNELGYHKHRGRVFVRMERFGPWVRSNPLFKLSKVPPSQSYEDFLRTGKGYFRLSEVCNLFGDSLPFSYLIFKRQADRAPNGISEAGIFKFDKTYILDLGKFCHWLATNLEEAL